MYASFLRRKQLPKKDNSAPTILHLRNQWSSKSKFVMSKEVLCSRILYWRVEVAWNARLTTTQNSMLKSVFRTFFNKEVRAARTMGG